MHLQSPACSEPNKTTVQPLDHTRTGGGQGLAFSLALSLYKLKEQALAPSPFGAQHAGVLKLKLAGATGGTRPLSQPDVSPAKSPCVVHCLRVSCQSLAARHAGLCGPRAGAWTAQSVYSWRVRRGATARFNPCTTCAAAAAMRAAREAEERRPEARRAWVQVRGFEDREENSAAHGPHRPHRDLWRMAFRAGPSAASPTGQPRPLDLDPRRDGSLHRASRC